MKRAGDIVVSKSMLFGSVLFCVLAIVPHILKQHTTNTYVDVITIGIGWYAYLIFIGFLVSSIVGLINHGKNVMVWFSRKE